MRTLYISILLSSLFFLSGCTKTLQFANADPRIYEVSKKSGKTDGALEDLIAPYRTNLDKAMNSVIGQAGIKLTKGKPESTLGTFVANLLLESARSADPTPVDFAMQNYGGIRISEIPEGDITTGKIFELMPFDNLLVVVDCPSKIAKRFINDMARSGGAPLSSNISFSIVEKKAEHIKIDGKAFDESRNYRIAMPDYIANGGGGKDYLIDLPRLDSEVLIRDAIIEYVTNHEGPIAPKLLGSISVSNN